LKSVFAVRAFRGGTFVTCKTGNDACFTGYVLTLSWCCAFF
jgi:hypothetical protein